MSLGTVRKQDDRAQSSREVLGDFLKRLGLGLQLERHTLWGEGRTKGGKRAFCNHVQVTYSHRVMFSLLYVSDFMKLQIFNMDCLLRSASSPPGKNHSSRLHALPESHMQRAHPVQSLTLGASRSQPPGEAMPVHAKGGVSHHPVAPSSVYLLQGWQLDRYCQLPPWRFSPSTDLLT